MKHIFIDPVDFDKKVDPNKLKFGSKVNISDGKNGAKREKYYTVKEIVDTNLIRLNNDLMIRLIGVKPKSKDFDKAKQFLIKKILHRQIFLKFDESKYDKDNNLMAYLYMKNKTFINAHLLKEGFAEVDQEFPFKYKSRFEKFQKEKVVHESSN